MLTMNVEIWPFGNESEAKRLVTINLANVGTSSYDDEYDYVWTIDEFKPLFGIAPIEARGVLRRYNRRATCIDMLGAILDDFRTKSSVTTMTQSETEVAQRLRNRTIKSS